MRIKLKDYKKNRVQKIDCVTTGVSVSRAQKIFIESQGINLSALLRDVIDSLMAENEAENKEVSENENKKNAS